MRFTRCGLVARRCSGGQAAETAKPGAEPACGQTTRRETEAPLRFFGSVPNGTTDWAPIQIQTRSMSAAIPCPTPMHIVVNA